ncbi:hypothetical protein F5B19DRAFT_438624 [Rostrohypoxylon terebratum]|nr:hypothetical protein F5B19DRAFT_438624 [Rostrohypoxylon terebratum]
MDSTRNNSIVFNNSFLKYVYIFPSQSSFFSGQFAILASSYNIQSDDFMKMSSSQSFQGKMRCEHGLVHCSQCLHSMNSIENGFIPAPEPGSRIPCSEKAHSVEPVFDRLLPTAENMGFHQGLSPEYRNKLITDLSAPQDGRKMESYMLACGYCGLDYIDTGNRSHSHPSHAGEDDQRYFLASVRPYEYARSGDKFKCSAEFIFSHYDSVVNVAFECLSKFDSVSNPQWNPDNAEIAAMVQFMHYVEDVVIPYRKRIVEEYVYTNSEYFAGQAWRFNLLVHSTIDREVYDFLLEAHRLQYSSSRKAFVKRNALGMVTKQYLVTDERRYQTVSFIKMNERLASLGIRV